MIKINIEKALSLVKRPNPINVAEELIKRFNILTVDRIERLYSILYYSGRMDLIKGSEKNQLIMVKAGIRHLSNESERFQDELEDRLLKDNLI